MKKSVINQFEKTLREQFSIWDDITIERNDTDAFTTFYIIENDSVCFYEAPLKKALSVTDAYNITQGYGSVSLFINTRTYEGGWVKPIIEILIDKTKK